MTQGLTRPWSLAARWVFPADAPPVEDGLVVVNGTRIASVGPRGRAAPDVDLGDVAVLPGLVNAHTHLDLSGLRGAVPPTPDFTAWLRAIIAYRRSAGEADADAAVAAGLRESLAAGTTYLGDISVGGRSWGPLAAAPLRGVVFREVIGLALGRAFDGLLAVREWARSLPPRSGLRAGVSPHAPYSVNGYGFTESARIVRHIPVAVHLAESRAEIELLDHRTGPFVAFLEELGLWEPSNLVHSPARVVAAVTQYQHDSRRPVLLVHCNYLPPNVDIPPKATVVYCPRTHTAFGHDPYPLAQYLARGVRVAVGTDSLASNPGLDVLGELREVWRRHPHVGGAAILRLGTLSGAEAFGYGKLVGSLTPGKSADLVVVPLDGPASADAHERWLGGVAPVSATLYQGRWRTNSPPNRLEGLAWPDQPPLSPPTSSTTPP